MSFSRSGIDPVGRDHRSRIGRIVVRARRGAEAAREIDLVPGHEHVAVEVVPVIRQRGLPGGADAARRVDAQAVVAGGAGLEHRLSRAAQVVGEGQPRRQVVVDRIAIGAGEVHRRQQVGQDRVGLDVGRNGAIVLVIESQAPGQGGALHLVRVAEVQRVLPHLPVGVAVARDVHFVDPARADAGGGAAAGLADGLVRRAPPPGAELGRVVAAEERRQEVVAVEARLVGRPDVVAQASRSRQRVAIVHIKQALHVGEVVFVEVEQEPGVVVAVLGLDHQPVARDPVVLGLVVIGRAGLPVGGLDAGRRVGAARVANLVAAAIEEGRLVARRPAVVQLEVLVVEHRLVGLEVVGVGRTRRGARLEEAEHADLDALAADRAPEPRLVLDDRTADFDAVLDHVLQRVAGAAALRRDFRRRVRRLEALVAVEQPARALQLVAAALGHEVDGHAAGFLRRVAAGGGDLNLLERIEVEVGGRRPGGHVGDRGAIEVPLLVAGAAVRAEAGLLARRIAAHVLHAHHHAGRLLENHPRVAGRRNGFEQLLAEVGAERVGTDVDDRTFAGDRHRFLHARQLEAAVDLGVEAGLDAHVRPDDPLEAGQLERHGVDADGQVGKTVGAAGRRRGRLRLNQRRAGQNDRGPGSTAPL